MRNVPVDRAWPGDEAARRRHVRDARRGRRRPERYDGPTNPTTGFVVAVVTASVCWVLADRAAAATTLVMFCAATFVISTGPRWTGLLRLAPLVSVVGVPLLGALMLLVTSIVYRLDALQPWHCGVLFAVALGLMMIGAALSSRRPRRAARVAVIGSQAVADALARELAAGDCRRYQVVGRVVLTTENGRGPSSTPGDKVATLGSIDNLAALVAEERIDLIVMTGEVPRLDVFSQLADGHRDCYARVVELSDLYEDVFGHVPVGEINAAWFQYAMHPGYRPPRQVLKRALDVLIAGAGLLLALPFLAVVIPAIRRDGGPALFRQTRIGDGGRQFMMLKLRTMVVGTDQGAQWTSFEDPRVTRLGRLLRRSNLDELPQFLNVLRGEMSIVGPRPEQPEFVERLERIIPFYQRRHLIKPGLTGWSQVRCGYIRSDRGSAWKLCHDLYYVKHRSMLLDLAILFETVLTMFRGPVYGLEPGRAIEFAHVEEKGLILAG